MRSLCLSLLLVLATASPASAVPFWGAKESSPAGTPPAALKPGEFVWEPGVAPNGPIVVIVSLTEQRAYVYRNGIEIGYTTVSTGKPGHATTLRNARATANPANGRGRAVAELTTVSGGSQPCVDSSTRPAN